MKDKKNIVVWVAILIVAIIAVIGLFFGGTKTIVKEVPQEFGASGTRFPNGLSTNTTQPSAGQLLTTTLTATASSTVFGSQVPRVLRGAVTVGTTSPITAITHTGSPIACSVQGMNLFADSTGVFNPSVDVSIGLGTNSLATRLIATTTIATTTDQMVATTTVGVPIVVTNGQKFTVSFADTQAANASSTYYSNITANLSIPCWTIGL